MTRRKTLSDRAVADLKARAARYTKPDPELTGHYVRVTPSGHKSFVAVSRDPNGKQIWHTIGNTSLYRVEEAREKAREIIKAIKAGAGVKEKSPAVKDVIETWFKRHVLGHKLRSHAEIRRYLDKHILPEWGGRDFESVRRMDVAEILDKIEDSSGPVAADKTLAIIRSLCNWYAARNEKYQSPVVKGMRRSNPQERARDRTLNDEEIVAVWKQAEANGTFGAIVRMLLLTAQRREKVVTMKWEDVLDGTWTIAAEDREKGNAGELVLPEIAIEIINAQPRFSDNPYIFAGRDKSYFTGVSKYKRAFAVSVPIESWTLHDLRRTARSLMSRAGVSFDIAERTLGHTIRGVAGTYDRHTYREEKADALRRLAGLIEQIINPPADNVVQLVTPS